MRKTVNWVFECMFMLALALPIAGMLGIAISVTVSFILAVGCFVIGVCR